MELNATDNILMLTPLHVAVLKHHLDAVKVLVADGANIDAKTPLALALSHGQGRHGQLIINFLRAKGVN